MPIFVFDPMVRTAIRAFHKNMQVMFSILDFDLQLQSCSSNQRGTRFQRLKPKNMEEAKRLELLQTTYILDGLHRLQQ